MLALTLGIVIRDGVQYGVARSQKLPYVLVQKLQLFPPLPLAVPIVILSEVELPGSAWDKVSCTFAAAIAHADCFRR